MEEEKQNTDKLQEIYNALRTIDNKVEKYEEEIDNLNDNSYDKHEQKLENLSDEIDEYLDRMEQIADHNQTAKEYEDLFSSEENQEYLDRNEQIAKQKEQEAINDAVDEAEEYFEDNGEIETRKKVIIKHLKNLTADLNILMSYSP